jgi:GntR family transcriptional regulator, transcriptional repressor for pyruvate dehydrogenase complex
MVPCLVDASGVLLVAIEYDGLVTEGLAKQISEKIRDAILDGRLAVDARLPTEEELAARFSVSRPTIREALKRLAAQNLIRSRRGPTGGTFVTRPTREEARVSVATAAALLVSMGEFQLDDIIEGRSVFETAACRLAAQRRTDQDLEDLKAAVAQMREADLADVEFCAADVRFHRHLVTAAHNPALDYAAASLIDSLQPVVNMVVYKDRDRRAVAAELQRVVDALTAREADAAVAALETYFAMLARQCRRAVERKAMSRSAEKSHG